MAGKLTGTGAAPSAEMETWLCCTELMGSSAVGWNTLLLRSSCALPEIKRGGPLAALHAPVPWDCQQVPKHGQVPYNFHSPELHLRGGLGCSTCHHTVPADEPYQQAKHSPAPAQRLLRGWFPLLPDPRRQGSGVIQLPG